ncbi:MAG: hypothetical protein KKA62_05185 [Nanoarchaeota archaeon]|nr:hypothetical protein [Nanoarchaeota archaeon]MBU1977315.1 hypothetical protein [Nanoarchaeota archaeon]
MKPDFTLGKCKTKATYSAKLRKKEQLDLKKIKDKFEVILETPILLVLKVEDVEVIVHGYGELLFKNCDDFSLMERLSEQIYSVGLKNKKE